MTAAGLVRGSTLVVVLVAAPVAGLPHWVLNMLVLVLIFAVLASAWNLVGGLAGYPSLGHAAFFGLGAYGLALLLGDRPLHSGYEPFWWLPVVGLGVAVAAVPIAAVAMRTRADVFAIVTITLLFVVQTLAFNLRSLTGGSQGRALPVAPFPTASFERPFCWAAGAMLVIVMGLTYGVLRGKAGLALAAVRGDEGRARGVGVPVGTVKVAAFAASAGLTAMAGGLWAYYESFIYPQFAVDPLVSIAAVLMTFLGGRGTLWGPVLGAVVLETGQQYLAYQLGGSQLYLIAYALVFLVVIRLLPAGVLPTVAAWRRRRVRSAVPA
jgi:branched-chain amino acid transport system permease protein